MFSLIQAYYPTSTGILLLTQVWVEFLWFFLLKMVIQFVGQWIKPFIDVEKGGKGANNCGTGTRWII
jgi:hypothetical protein